MRKSSLPENILTEECLRHFQKGSNLSYMAIVCHFRESLGEFVYRLTGNTKTTLEIVEDSFNKLWLRHEMMRTADDIETFLLTAARHTCFIHLDQSNHP